MSFENNREDLCCDNDVSNLDEKYVGKTIPQQFAQGPRLEKKCTDLFCCLIFVLFVGGMVFATFLHFPHSKINLMTTPRDSQGNICGHSDATKDYPYLYMVKFAAPYRSVCVKECLSFDYNQIRYNSDGKNTSVITPVTFDNFTDAVKAAGTKWDNKTQSPKISGIDDPNLFAYDPEAAQGYYTEAQWTAYQKRVKLDCKTNDQVSSCAHNPDNKVFYYDSKAVIFNLCFPLAPRLLKFASFAGDLKTGFVGDLKNAWWVILLSVLACVIIGCIFLLVATYFLPVLLWTQIILAILLMLALGAAGISFAFYSKNPKLEENLDKADEYSAGIRTTAETLKNRIWILWLVSVLLILGGIYFAYSVFTNRKAISLSLDVLKFSAKFIVANLPTVFVAIIAFILQIVTFLITVWGLLVLHTSGDFADSTTGAPIPTFKYTFGKTMLMIGGFFAVYWTVIFWNNMSDIICGGRAIHYYFKQETGIIKTTLNVLLYHIGTVAFCSLILTPCTILQFFFGWFYAMFTDDKPNFIQTCVSKVCCCLVYPYQKFINRTSETGLTMAYYTSCNFCPSTKRNHYLNRRVGDKIGSSGFISMLFKLSGMFAIASLNAFMWSWLLNNTAYFKKRIQNPLVPMFAIWIFGFITAALFMSIYSTACDAFTMCFLIEVDLNKTISQPDFQDIVQGQGKPGYKQL